VDLKNNLVIIDGGKDTLPYQKLVIATGGTPRRLPIENGGLENVYTFRGISDSQKVDAGTCIGFDSVEQGFANIVIKLHRRASELSSLEARSSAWSL
jgi:NADPH-dependent 2,4-dienoyl-CoA reductase/sulfur reductase-like enzyme